MIEDFVMNFVITEGIVHPEISKKREIFSQLTLKIKYFSSIENLFLLQTTKKQE